MPQPRAGPPQGGPAPRWTPPLPPTAHCCGGSPSWNGLGTGRRWVPCATVFGRRCASGRWRRSAPRSPRYDAPRTRWSAGPEPGAARRARGAGPAAGVPPGALGAAAPEVPFCQHCRLPRERHLRAAGPHLPDLPPGRGRRRPRRSGAPPAEHTRGPVGAALRALTDRRRGGRRRGAPWFGEGNQLGAAQPPRLVHQPRMDRAVPGRCDDPRAGPGAGRQHGR